tara:strand:+ start:661 stop:1053 length:393 start_codon:yes stop_codon:yes gene_type:complete
MKDEINIKLLKLKLLFVDEASIKFNDERDGVTETFIVTVTKHEWEHDVPKPDWNVLDEDAFEKFQRDVVDNYTNTPFIANYSYEVSHISDPEDWFFRDSHDIWDIEGALSLAYQDFFLWKGWKHNLEERK